jgi:hypothetical protein
MQSNLFNQDKPAKQVIDIRKDFTAPKNIRLGGYYTSRTGRVFMVMFYVFCGADENGAVIKLKVREGREEPFLYKELDVEEFSAHIQARNLILMM